MKPIIAQKPEEIFEEIFEKLKENPSTLEFFSSKGLIKNIPVEIKDGNILDLKRSIDALQKEFENDATIVVAHVGGKKVFLSLINKISEEDQRAFAERAGIMGADWFRTFFNFEEDEEAANIALLGCLIGKEPYPSQKK